MNLIVYFNDTGRRYLSNVTSIEHEGDTIIISNDYSSAEYDTKEVCNIMINDFINESEDNNYGTYEQI